MQISIRVMETHKSTIFTPINMEYKAFQMLMIFLSLASVSYFSLASANEMVSLQLRAGVTSGDAIKLETYIVHVKKPEDIIKSDMDLDGWYELFLPDKQQPRMMYSYKNVVTGFSAKLTADEAKAMEGKEGVLSVRPDKKLSLLTTHSPRFLGLNQNVGFWKQSNFGEGVIIGVLDTGIKPDHPSFSDEGMLPPPAKWKGTCEFNGKVACNKKIIGARNFLDPGQPPFDDDGHGTHTASTAAGNFVKDANVFGNAKGTAAGIAPRAYLAIYKVCDEFECLDSALLAAMDAAVDDGVDILSLSIGGGSFAFYEDSIALGAFGAIQKGIFVSCAAGNSGPLNASLSNEAPWILTVGASTIDRTIAASAKLGNGEVFVGESLFQPKNFPSKLLPLVYAGANHSSSSPSTFCALGSLRSSDVKGKVVVCERGGGIARTDKGQAVKDAGGAAMIMINDELDGFSTVADPHVLPASHVSYTAGLKIKAYINSTKSPTATILFDGTQIGNPLAPEVTSFSSRGPSLASPGILKPDILGPGVSILAAWPVSVENNTRTSKTFNMDSGTSMACPHLSGVAALLRSAHPDWSPAAIKSAIMTTADLLNLGGDPIVDETRLPANIFSIGAGHVNPSKANDPGFLYDIQPDDYIPYLCGLSYTDDQVSIIINRNISCSTVISIPEAQLNYPGFSIKLGSTPQKYTRSITNIGDTNLLYRKQIIEPEGVQIDVSPNGFEFSAVNLTATYHVTFTRKGNISAPVSHGYIKWESTRYSIKIPVAVTFE